MRAVLPQVSAVMVIVIGVMGAALLGVGVVLALLARPIADDYGSIAALREAGITQVFTDYAGRSGRFTNILICVIPYVVLGDRALWLVPLVLIGILIASLGYVGSRLVAAAPTAGMVLGAATGAVSIVLQPGLFDVVSWYTSSTLYLATIAFLSIGLALLVALARATAQSRPRIVVLLALTVFFVQGLSEPSALLSLALAIAGLALVLFKRFRSRGRVVAAGAIAGASIFGFLAAWLAPGRMGRVHLQMGGSSSTTIPEMLQESVGDIGVLTVKVVVLGAAGLTVLLIGGVSATLVPPLSWQVRFAVTGIGICVAAASIFATGLLVRLGYSGGEVPGRAWSFAVWSLICIGVAVVAVLLSGVRPRSAYSAVAMLASFALLLAGAAFQAKPTVAGVVEAAALRAGLVDARDAQVRAQLARGAEIIEITPAPILLRYSGTTDYLYPSSSGPTWTEGPIRKYLGIPKDTKVVAAPQPAGYCLPDYSDRFWNIQDCSELAATTRGADR